MVVANATNNGARRKQRGRKREGRKEEYERKESELLLVTAGETRRIIFQAS